MPTQNLMAAAVAEFAAKGIDGASTRTIAAAAGTVMSSITYNYGSKEGLYIAATNHICNTVRTKLRVFLSGNLLESAHDYISARLQIYSFISYLIDILLDDSNRGWSLFLAREQLNQGKGFNILYESCIKDILETLVALVCLATETTNIREAKIISLTLLGQVLILSSSRAVYLKLLNKREIDNHEANDFKSRIYANADAILGQFSSENSQKVVLD